MPRYISSVNNMKNRGPNILLKGIFVIISGIEDQETINFSSEWNIVVLMLVFMRPLFSMLEHLVTENMIPYIQAY